MKKDKIDQRIVEMSFENQKFEKGIAQSENSLKEFSNALKKSGVGDNFSGLEKSVTSLSNSFSILEQVGIGALRRMGESAVDAGVKIVKSLSIDQLTAGWTKYEQKTASVQTIMNATGKSIDEVNGYLDQLMWFSDETSYGFTDMTAALAQMTSSGGDVKALIPLITGVANATAFAGKGAAEFSRAMYNINQSYGAGSLQYIDWRSLELAGVAGKQLKQIFIETGIELGALNKKGQTVKGTVIDIGNFSTTLQEKWANPKVMEAAFGKFSELSEAAYKLVNDGTYDTASEAMDALAGQYSNIAETSFRAAQTSKTFGESINATMDAVSSGWMRTYEIIFGDIEEAKKNFASLTEILLTVFASGVENRNEMLKWLKEAGGISNVFQGFKNIAVSLLNILKPISQAFYQIFPPKTREQWLTITESFKTFTSTLVITEETANKIRRTFAGLFAVVDIGWQAFKFLGSAALEVIKIFLPLTGGILGASASLGDFLVNLDKAIKSSKILQYGLLAIKIGIALLRTGISNLISIVSEFVSGLWNAKDPFEYLKNVGVRAFSGIVEGIKMAVSWLSDKFMKAVKTVSDFFNKTFDDSAVDVWSKILKILKDAVEFISGKASKGFKNFGDTIKNLDFRKISAFVIGGVLLIFVKQLSDLTGALTGFTNAATGVVKGFAKKFLSNNTIGLIHEMAIALGVLAASIWVLSTIPADDLKKSLISIGIAIGVFVAAYGALIAIQVAASKKMKNTEMISSTFNLTGLAASLLIMAVAVNKISKIDATQVWNSIAVLSAMTGIIVAYELFQVILARLIPEGEVSWQLGSISTSLLMLVGIITILKYLSISDVTEGLAKITAILAVIGAAELLFGIVARISKDKKVSVSFLEIAVGITAMIGVMKLLTIIKPSTIKSGANNLLLIASLLAGVEIIMGLAGCIGGGKKAQTNILKTSAGLLAMIGLLKLLEFVSQETINHGIITLAKMSGIIAGIELLTALSSRISGGSKVQSILGSVTITLAAFTGIITILGSIKDSSIIDQGVSVITKMVGLISAIELVTAVASRISIVTDKAGNATKGSGLFGSLIGVTIAIVTLSGALALLSLIPTESLQGAANALAIASVAILALSFAMEKISKAVDLLSKNSKGFRDKIKTIGPILVALGAVLVATIAFFGTLKIISLINDDVSWNSIEQFIVGLATITALIFAFNSLPISEKEVGERLSNLVPGFTAMIGVVLATAGFFEALSWVLSTLNKTSWGSLGKFMAGIAIVGVLVTAITLLGKDLAILGPAIGPALLGVIAAIASIALVVLAAIGLAALLDWMIDENAAISLTKGFDILVLIAAGMGRVVGAFATGIGAGVLEGIAYSIVGFANALSGFTPESLESIRALATAILLITSAAVMEGLSRMLSSGTSSMTIFGEQLNGLIAALSKVSVTDVTKASDALAAMLPMANNLKTFAIAAKEIPPSGGLVQGIMGNTTPKEFGEQLSGLVTAFKDVTVANVTAANDVLIAMIPMITNLEAFITLTEKIPSSGGLVQGILGNTTPDEFGEQLSGLVTAFKDVTAVNATAANDVLIAMIPMITNLEAFITLTKKIPPSGGLVQGILGNTTPDEFGEQLKGLVTAFADINPTDVPKASGILAAMVPMITNLEKFITLAEKITPSEGFFQGIITSLFGGSTSLSSFGAEFKKFVNSLSGTDFKIVNPAMEAMGKVTTSFKTIGATVIANAKKSFENNKEPFQTAIATILDAPIKKLDLNKKTLANTVSTIIKEVTDKSDSYKKKFKTLGEDLINGLKSGIESKKPSALTSIEKVMSDVVTTAKKVVDSNSPSKVFTTIGGWCTKGLANGILKETNVAVKAGTNMAKATEESVRDTLGVHSISDIFSGIGKYLPASISEGIQNGKGALLDIAEKLGIDTSNITLEGIVSSISGGEGGITSGINSLLELLTGTSKDAATDTGSGIGNTITDAFNKALSDSSSGLGGSATQTTVKSELDKLKAIIEEREFYGTITVEQELELYQKLRESYKEGSEERKQIDREIYTRLKTIYDAQMSYIDSVNKAQSDAADERDKLEKDYIKNVADAQAEANKKSSDLKKKYDKDVLQAKVDADSKTQTEDKNYYSSLNSILDDAEKEREKIREQYASNQKSINTKLLSDIDSQNKAYEDAVKSRADAIYNSYNLFAAVDEDTAVSGDELLKNLQDQGAALSEWKQSLAALAGRGVGDALIEEIQAMGPSSKAQIKALLTLTDEQLTEYVGLFEGKYTFARVKAEDELEGLKNSTIQTIQDLNAQAAIDLDTLEIEFDDSMSAINAKMAADMVELRDTHNATLKDIASDLEKNLNELESTWNESSTEIQTDLDIKLSDLESTYNSSLEKINTDLNKNLDEMKTKFSTTMKEIAGLTEEELRKLIEDNNVKLTQLNTETAEKLDEVKKTYDTSGDKIVTSFGSTLQALIPNTESTISTLITTVKNSFESANYEFEKAGYNVAAGFAKGISDGSYMAINAAEYLADAAVIAANKILNENSPSKVFEGIGKFVSMGFANGITGYAEQAIKASKNMASGPIAVVSQALADMEESDDLTFTITPVLDLSAVKSNNIAQLLNTPVQLGDTSSKLAVETLQNGNREQVPTTTIINKFDLTGLTVRKESDVDDIATKLYNKQQIASRGRGQRTPVRA